ncbi:nucleoprotein TPR [Drosophila montana]|uniref:nucleoprotein TPR n=1 Tax=Drosophila montana TaxID=40370 RepID=UPI00313ACB21
MSQEAITYQFPSGAGEVALCVERLIKETNEDLKNFRVEQSDLRSLISAVLNENRHLTGELGKFKKVMCSKSSENIHERLHFANDALVKAMAQIEALKQEQRSLQTLQECSQRTIKSMEVELNTYRAQLPQGGNDQMAQKYNKAVRMLEARLSEQQEEIRTQANLIKALHEHKQRCGEQIDQLRSQLKERHHDAATREEEHAKLASLHKQLKEFEKSLMKTRALLDESKKREVEAMRKVHDALSVSEAAVREKEDAEKLAESYKEEASHLAFNIGSIMDEAANRVDSEVAQLRTKLAEKDKTITSLREKLKNEAMEYKRATQALECRIERITLKYKEALNQNAKLEKQVESCNKRLIELEESAFNDETHHLQHKKDYESKMETYLNSYKELKAHYKELLQDLTKKFEGAFESLHKEKCELQAENEMLRNGAAGDGMGKIL